MRVITNGTAVSFRCDAGFGMLPMNKIIICDLVYASCSVMSSWSVHVVACSSTSLSNIPLYGHSPF